MNRNTVSRFDLAPQVQTERSTFDRKFSHKTTLNVGEIIPFYCDEVLPGDTFEVTTSYVARLQTLITPVMDNLYLDTYYFFVPNRLVWEHWRNLMGENTASAWIPATNYSVPQITAPSGGWNVGTIADYFGIPTGVGNISVNAMPFRAYALICNEFFRDENLSNPINIPVNDSTQTGSNGSNQVTDIANGGTPFIAAKYHDYFTSALPSPQKGPDTLLPLGTSAPVITSPTMHSDTYMNDSNRQVAIKLQERGKLPSVAQSDIRNIAGYGQTTGSFNTTAFGTPLSSANNFQLYPTNLYADLTNATAATINQLRQAFQIQRLYEKDARGGTRYIEILKAHFGVSSPDARLQRPEYLGGHRNPFNVQQVTQTSSTDSTTPQGNNAGMSVTGDVNDDFRKSFTEHGFVIGLAVARYEHTYQQGIERMFSRTGRFDYYWPVLANIGEQAILNKEIYAQGSTALNPSTGKPYDNEVFGYQEAWADYRFKFNRVSGDMRSASTQSLDIWHFGDDYASMPYLSDSWIREDKVNVDRVLAASSSLTNQCFIDFYVKNKCTRPMPLYSVPGLIDHN